MHAPLLMRSRRDTAARPQAVTVVDVIPTLLGRLPLPPLDALLPQASGRDALAPNARSLPIFSQDTGRARAANEQRSALTTDRWKFLRVEEKGGGVRRQLFDRDTDRFELNDVSAEHPEVTERSPPALRSR